MQLQDGRKIDRYVIGSRVGEGANAVVYAAKHESLGTEHAIKVLTRATPEITRRLRAEGRAQAHLRHPNIVNVTDIIAIDGQPGLVMELVRGPSLSALMARGRLPFERIDALVEPILKGVAFAHERGVLHRDLKPDNILIGLSPTGPVPKILDFGLVKFVSTTLHGSEIVETVGHLPMGTPYYMAPEQFDPNLAVTGATDVWSLGVLLYELVTGERPFQAGNILDLAMVIGTGEYLPIDELRAQVPERWKHAITRALTVDPEARWSSPSALLAAWSGNPIDGEVSATDRPAEDPWTAELRRMYTGEDREPPPQPFDAAAETIDPGTDWQHEVDTSEVPKALPAADTQPLSPSSGTSLVPFLFLGGAMALLLVIGLLAVGVLSLSGSESTPLESRPTPVSTAVPPASVTIEGVESSFVRLRDNDGLYLVSEPVPAGVYEVLLRDEHGEEHVALRDFALVSGQSRTLKCKAKTWTCSPSEAR
jgi:serine/threonine protein kinase